jgi:hypothetical protein
MIIYNPNNESILKERLNQAEDLLKQIPVKHCFITGSFLYKKNYNDIDVFVISRSKKKLSIDNKKAKITIIDFNDLHSLFYHSISKCCVSKNFLLQKSLKVTFSDFWNVINEAVPTLLNQKNKFHKNVRFLILYMEYFRTGTVLDSFQLFKKVNSFSDYHKILSYVNENMPQLIQQKIKPSYLKRFFYTQAGFYRESLNYSAQKYLYDLTHSITRGSIHG